MFKPVCGMDGRNFANECLMKCSKVDKAFDGRCELGSVVKCLYCLGKKDPVCGKDKKTYDNLCYLKCNKVELDYDGPCKPTPVTPCTCASIYLPICTSTGETFPNECLAKCKNLSVVHNGSCKPKPMDVPHHDYDKSDSDNCLKGCAKFGSKPICGSDGKTYGNKCATTCSSVLQVHVLYPKPCKPIATRFPSRLA